MSRFTPQRPHAFRITVGLALLGLAGVCSAQSTESDHPVSLSVGGGLTTITGRNAGKLDHGGNVQLTAGHFFNRYFGVTGTFIFNDLGLTGRALAELNEPDGSARVYTVTFDPVFRIPLRRGWSAYLLAGGGYLRRTIEFTQPAVAQALVIDPWFGYVGPALVPVNEILGSVISNTGAYDVGGGVNVPWGQSAFHLYIETRYVHGFTSNSNTSIVPIDFGVRW